MVCVVLSQAGCGQHEESNPALCRKSKCSYPQSLLSNSKVLFIFKTFLLKCARVSRCTRGSLRRPEEGITSPGARVRVNREPCEVHVLWVQTLLLWKNSQYFQLPSQLQPHGDFSFLFFSSSPSFLLSYSSFFLFLPFPLLFFLFFFLLCCFFF